MTDPSASTPMTDDPYSIATLEQLRAVIPEPKPSVHAKIVTHLGRLERDFVARGFVAVADDRTLLIPERSGNGLAYGLTNLVDNPHIGLLFVIPGSTETFRVEGEVSLTRDPQLLGRFTARGKDALLVIRVRIERCYFHCAKAFLRSRLWESAEWPERFPFSWSAWARQWFDAPAETGRKIDAEIARDEAENL
jgi:predicted pyridoxine 5'-phosphate oxidase superfamily flavin-nucleotide-binding protein